MAAVRELRSQLDLEVRGRAGLEGTVGAVFLLLCDKASAVVAVRELSLQLEVEVRLVREPPGWRWTCQVTCMVACLSWDGG